MSLFPAQKRKRVIPNVPQNKVCFPIYCSCRLPKSGKMIMCENCAEWFHKECVKTAPAVWKKKEEQWFCVNCEKMK